MWELNVKMSLVFEYEGWKQQNTDKQWSSSLKKSQIAQFVVSAKKPDLMHRTPAKTQRA